MQIYSKYENDYHKACNRFIKVRSEFLDKLQRVSYLRVMPTQANFVLCEVMSPYTANDLALKLLKDFNILISACSAKKGIEPDKYVRIAIRSKEDNDRLINALMTI
jgi:histidinol-phosphate/aromatic aminotransferase/cobyric acid decarboxylase-like protein